MNQSNTRTLAIEQVTLTEEEERLAIWQAKYVKWNKERFKDYWQEQEGKTKKKCTASTGTETE